MMQGFMSVNFVDIALIFSKKQNSSTAQSNQS